jgi:hypothetical protein
MLPRPRSVSGWNTVPVGAYKPFHELVTACDGRHAMDCGTFLNGYSDFRDELLPARSREAFAAHARDCARCARYDRVIRGGVQVLTAGDDLRVSEDFMDRLQHRLYHVDDELAAARGRRSAGSGRVRRHVAVAAAIVAVAIAPRFWIPGAPTVTMLPSVVAVGPGSAEWDELPDVVVAASGEAGLTARLEEVGVRVLPLPYRDVVHHSASRVTLAAYSRGE